MCIPDASSTVATNIVMVTTISCTNFRKARGCSATPHPGEHAPPPSVDVHEGSQVEPVRQTLRAIAHLIAPPVLDTRTESLPCRSCRFSGRLPSFLHFDFHKTAPAEGGVVILPDALRQRESVYLPRNADVIGRSKDVLNVPTCARRDPKSLPSTSSPIEPLRYPA